MSTYILNVSFSHDHTEKYLFSVSNQFYLQLQLVKIKATTYHLSMFSLFTLRKISVFRCTQYKSTNPQTEEKTSTTISRNASDWDTWAIYLMQFSDTTLIPLKHKIPLRIWFFHNWSSYLILTLDSQISINMQYHRKMHNFARM